MSYSFYKSDSSMYELASDAIDKYLIQSLLLRLLLSDHDKINGADEFLSAIFVSFLAIIKSIG